MTHVSANKDAWTVGRLLEWTTQFFRGKQIDNPRLDAEVLLAHILSCRRIDLYVGFDDDVAPADRARYRDAVRRRAEGTPVAYLVGRREFYSLDFDVNESVLIPRPETEILVGEAMARLPPDRPATFLDIGVGSGAVAIAIAVHRENASAVAVDISLSALAVARKNAEKHGVLDRIQFRESRLFENLDPSIPFDLLVSNPPYVRTAEWNDLSRDVRDYEPRCALDGGDDGLHVLRPLIELAPNHLRPGGWLVVEFGVDHAQPLASLAERGNRYDSILVVNDAARRPRVLCARCRS